MEKIKSTKLKFLALVMVVMLIAWLMPISFVFGQEEPSINASLNNDWIELWAFAPDADIDIEIVSIGTYSVHTDEFGNARFEGGTEGINLVAGMTITAGLKELVLVDLTLDVFDLGSDIISGTADVLLVGADVFVNVGNESGEGANMVVQVLAGGAWSANFKTIPFDITYDMWADARIFDDEGDATVAQSVQPPSIEASLTNDWIKLWSFTPEENVQLEIVGFWSDTVPTDGEGDAEVLGSVHDRDIVPGTHITAKGLVSGIIKDLVVADLTIDVFDLESDIISGTGPEGGIVYVLAAYPVVPDYEEMYVYVDASGNWSADFGAEGIDLVKGMGGSSGSLMRNVTPP